MTDTVVACLTPAGAAAIATLGVHGPDAWRVCRALFTPRSAPLPEEPEAIAEGRFFLGRLGDALRDEAILALRRAVPVPSVELHCHGGREVLAVLLETFQQHGARVISWREWHERTAGSAFRAAALTALAQALTTRTSAILLDQYHGAFDAALEAVRQSLDRGDRHGAEQRIGEMLRHAGVGLHLTRPWRVAVAGAPNVGKSSLVNALAGFQRCVVSELPGTTRDVVTTRIAVDGWPIELADTAGLRDAPESLEEAGVRLARETAATADLCLWVADGSAVPVWPGSLGVPVLRVVNKIDLPAAWDVTGVLRVSARTREGLAELCAALAARLVPEPPAPGAAVPFTAECCTRLDEARLQLSGEPGA